MLISTKGRYALRIMVDLAEHEPDTYVSLSDIAKRQNISIKYLETIIGILNKAAFVKSLRGKYGGYKLSRKPDEYSVREIVSLTEGSLVVVNSDCCSKENNCVRKDICTSQGIWIELENIVTSFLESKKLSDLI